jgi:hypothetical protein
MTGLDVFLPHVRQLLAAMEEAKAAAELEQRSMAVRCTPQGVWYHRPTTAALDDKDCEVATVHCNGIIELTESQS